MGDISIPLLKQRGTAAVAATAAIVPAYFPWEEIIEWKGRPYDKMSFTSPRQPRSEPDASSISSLACFFAPADLSLELSPLTF
jgi:hypothetical protein